MAAHKAEDLFRLAWAHPPPLVCGLMPKHKRFHQTSNCSCCCCCLSVKGGLRVEQQWRRRRWRRQRNAPFKVSKMQKNRCLVCTFALPARNRPSFDCQFYAMSLCVCVISSLQKNGIHIFECLWRFDELFFLGGWGIKIQNIQQTKRIILITWESSGHSHKCAKFFAKIQPLQNTVRRHTLAQLNRFRSILRFTIRQFWTSLLLDERTNVNLKKTRLEFCHTQWTHGHFRLLNINLFKMFWQDVWHILQFY